MSSFNLVKMGHIFVQNVVKLQYAVGLNQRDFAAHIGVSESTLRRIQRHHLQKLGYSPQFGTTAKAALFAGVSVDDLMKTRLNFVKQ